MQGVFSRHWKFPDQLTNWNYLTMGNVVMRITDHAYAASRTHELAGSTLSNPANDDLCMSESALA
jgi:hypothetical protein